MKAVYLEILQEYFPEKSFSEIDTLADILDIDADKYSNKRFGAIGLSERTWLCINHYLNHPFVMSEPGFIRRDYVSDVLNITLEEWSNNVINLGKNNFQEVVDTLLKLDKQNAGIIAWMEDMVKFSESDLLAKYPVKVSEDFYLSEDKENITIINSFAAGSEDCALADPKTELLPREIATFYHRFMESPELIKAEIEEFLQKGRGDDAEAVALFRRDGDVLIEYGYGHICSIIANQNQLQELYEEKGGFILPLRIFMFKCPVCGQRMLRNRGKNSSCEECGWDDLGIDDPDEKPKFEFVNDGLTINEYRSRYQVLKEQR